mgnify:CR=1 FL=1
MTQTPPLQAQSVMIKKLLKKFTPFDTLSDDELSKLAESSKFIEAPKHNYLYKKDDDAGLIYFLVQGTIKVGNTTKDGREIIKSIQHPVSFFGESCLVNQSNRVTFVKALNADVAYFVINVEAIKDAMQHNFDFNIQVINMLGQKIKHYETRLESLLMDDARTRIISFIKELAIKSGVEIGYETLLKHNMTQQDIANFTGTSRQTVTSVLNDLKRSNQIYFKRKSILIRDIESLS